MQEKRKSLYREIYDYVYTLVANGDHPQDGRLPTENQLCRRFNASRSTVAKAMKELECVGVIRRQAGAGSFAIQAGQSKCTFAALLIAGLGDIEFFSPICAQIAQSCQRYNISLIWGNTGPATEISQRSDVDQIYKRLIEQRVTGVFFAPNQLSALHEGDPEAYVHFNIDQYLAEKLTKAGIAVVLIDRDLSPYPTRSEFDFVGIDNLHAAYEQTRHLYEQGCRKIVYVSRPGMLTTKAARTTGYRFALEQHGLTYRPDWVFVGDASDPDFVRQTLACEPDGVVCFNDPVASDYLLTLRKIGASVPGDVMLIGLDDLEYSRLLPVPLTTMRQPRKELGELAVEVLVRRLNNRSLAPSENLLTTSLVVRESTTSAAH